MPEDKQEEDVINYRIGLLVLRDSAVLELATMAEELRQIRIRREANPIPNANPFNESERQCLRDDVVDAVSKELELLDPKRWLGAEITVKEQIYNKVYDFVIDKILKSSEAIEEYIAVMVIIVIDMEADKILGINLI